MRRASLRAAICGLVGLCAVSETAQWLVSDDGPHAPPGRCAVLVLGAPAHADGSPSAAQRLRVAAGLHAAQTRHCDLLIVSGGAVHNRFAEADVMAKLAESARPPAARWPARVVREASSANTWENVRNALPLLDGRTRIVIASEGLHARRARRYLCRQSATICQAAEIAAAPRPWWMLPYRVGSSMYETAAFVRDALTR